MALISKECPTKIFSSFVMDWNIERNTFCCISKLGTKNTNFELKTAVLIVQCLFYIPSINLHVHKSSQIENLMPLMES